MRLPSMLWPTTPGAVLLLAHVVFLWAVVHYFLANDQLNLPSAKRSADETTGESAITGPLWRGPYRWPSRDQNVIVLWRAIFLAAVTTGIAGINIKGIFLGITAGVIGTALPLGRQICADRYRLSEWELGVNIAFLVATSIQVAASQETMRIAWILIRFPLPEIEVSAYLSVAAASVFLGRGGTLVVRGFLEQAGTLPEYAEEKKSPSFRIDASLSYSLVRDAWQISGKAHPLDETSPQEAPPVGPASPSVEGLDKPEVTRGRMIGNIERQLLLLLALAGSYPAVAFLMAAKGFVRAKEFEKRNYAEYFLIGTLASTALALLLGTLLRRAFPGVWPSP